MGPSSFYVSIVHGTPESATESTVRRQGGAVMAKRLSPEEVTTIVQSGDFDALLGAMEDHQLECKSSPYRLDDESEKFELAKDVSAMADVSGGVVLIGVRTRKDATLSADFVCDVSPFEESQISIKQYSDVLRQWVYPPLQTPEIRWWPSKNDSTKGIVGILVPSGTSPDAPHLVTRAPLTDTGQIKGTLFGHFQRLRADVQATSVQQLRERLKDGLRFQELDQRYQNIEHALAQLLKPPVPQYRPEMQLGQCIKGAEAAVELGSKARLTLAAIPEEAVELPGLIESRGSRVVRLLDDPPKIVEGGFNLGTRSPSQLLYGQRRQTVIKGYKLLELWRDGALIFVVAGDAQFLCWQTKSSPQAGLIINTLALTEVVYLFAELACEVYKESVPVPGKMRYEATLSAGENVPYVLSPCPVGQPWGELERHTAPWLGRSWCVKFDHQTDTPGNVAFGLLREIYAWFGLEADQIPYVDRSGPRARRQPRSNQTWPGLMTGAPG